MKSEGRARLVPLPGSRLRTIGMWGLGAGGVGGLGLDAVTFLITGRGDAVRIGLSAGFCLASAAVVAVGFVADRRLLRRHERGGAST
ncbi:MAG TPA: hypothetical protein VEM95_00220 [Thermoplasmata archaeon]|nr:hypothetical protein [Thermoplasmata archaeon]